MLLTQAKSSSSSGIIVSKFLFPSMILTSYNNLLTLFLRMYRKWCSITISFLTSSSTAVVVASSSSYHKAYFTTTNLRENTKYEMWRIILILLCHEVFPSPGLFFGCIMYIHISTTTAPSKFALSLSRGSIVVCLCLSMQFDVVKYKTGWKSE